MIGGTKSGWRDALVADIRFALRQFRRRWGTTAAMLTILSVGMSISILLFTVVYSYAVLPPPAVPRADDLVRIRGSHLDKHGDIGSRTFPLEELREYRRLDEHFSAVAGEADATVNLDATGNGESTVVTAEATFVTENYFAVLGVRPVQGTELPTYETDDPAVAVIGHVAWDQLFGRRPDVVGRTLHVNGVPVTIVGVAPPRFAGVGGDSWLWLPVASRHLVLSQSSAENLFFLAPARLRPGASPEAATAATQVVAARATAASDRPGAEELRSPSTEVVPLLALNGDPDFDQDVSRLVMSLGLLGLLVLLVTCTNVSTLLTGLATARRQEIAVRLSLGAPRSRIVRQLLTESALLAVLAGTVALGIVWAVLRAVGTMYPLLPVEVGVTWLATSFTAGVALAVGIVFGLAPALHATRAGIGSVLRDSTPAIAGTRLRLQRALVVAQIAFTQPLVVGVVAVLLIVLGQFQPANRNEFAEQLISLQLKPATRALRFGTGSEPPQELLAEVRRLRAELEATPGIAAAIPDSKAAGELGAYFVHPEDRVAGGLQESFRVSGNTAAPGFFSAVGIPLLRGREFTPTDVSYVDRNAGEVPVIIGGDLARRLWPGADPLERRLQAAGDSATGAATLRVTGVVADPNAGGAASREAPQIYLAPDTAAVPAKLLVRTTSDAQPLVSTVRRIVQEEAPSMIGSVQTVATIEDQSRSSFRKITGGLAGSAVLALLLSAIGLYAVVAFSVGQRASEIAVRMAIGASPQHIAGRFIVDGLRLGIAGLVLGLPVSLLGLQAVNAIPDPGFPKVALGPVMVLGVLGVLAVAVAATLVPARRAASTEPARVLR